MGIKSIFKGKKKDIVFVGNFNCECFHCGAPFWGRAKKTEYVSDVIENGKMTQYIAVFKTYRCKVCKKYWGVAYMPKYRFAIGDNGLSVSNLPMQYFPQMKG